MYSSNFVANCDFLINYLLKQHILKDDIDAGQILYDVADHAVNKTNIICDYPPINSHVKNIGKFPLTTMLPMISNVKLSSRPISVDRSSFFQTATREEYIIKEATNYMIITKPGIEINKLAAKLEDYFKCVHIDCDRLIEREIQSKSRLGIWLDKNLQLNKLLPIEIILWLIQRETKSVKVLYRGYIITGLPLIPNKDLNVNMNFLTEDEFLSFQQIVEELIDIPTKDRKRELAKLKKKLFSEYPILDDDGDDLKEDSTEGTQFEEGFRPPPTLFHRISCDEDVCFSIKRQLYFTLNLVNKPTILIYMDCEDEDIITKYSLHNSKTLDDLEGIRVALKRYNIALDIIQQFLLYYPESNLIYSQGIYDTEDMFRSCINKITNRCCYRKVFIGIDFYDSFKRDARLIEKLESAPTPQDQREMLYKINPIRQDIGWFKSWLENKCPVMTMQGKAVVGKYKHSVQFIGIIYLLSSDENKRLFLENPQSYIVPYPTCRVGIMGPSRSGRSTFARCLTHFFDNSVIIDVNYLFEYYRKNDVTKLYYADAIEQAISTLNSQVLDTYNKEKQMRLNKIDEWIHEVTPYIIDFHKMIATKPKKSKNQKSDKKALREKDRLKKLLSTYGIETDDTELLKTYRTSRDALLKKLPPDLQKPIRFRECQASDIDVKKLTTELMDNWSKDYVLPLARKLEILVTKIRLVEKRQKLLTNQQKLYGYWILDGLPPDIELFQGLQETDCLPDVIVSMDDSVGSRLVENQNLKCRTEFYDMQYVVDVITRTNEVFFKGKNLKIQKETNESLKFFGAQVVRRELDNILMQESLHCTNDRFEEENNKYRANFEQMISFLEPFDTYLIQVDLHNISWSDSIICGLREYMNYFNAHPHVLKEDWSKDETLPSDSVLRVGTTAEYCPVLFVDKMLLKLGLSKYAVQLKNKTYLFSSEEALKTFVKNPFKYSDIDRPFQIPPYRLCVIGNHHIAKRVDLRKVADILGTKHMSMDTMINWYLAKMDSSKTFNITTFYEILEDLGDDLVNNIVAPLYKDGFLFEDFPATADHLKQMIGLGHYPEQIFYIKIENKTLLKDELEYYTQQYEDVLQNKVNACQLQNVDWMSQRKARFSELIAKLPGNIFAEEEEDEDFADRLKLDILTDILNSFDAVPDESYEEQKWQLYVADMVNGEMPPDQYTKLIDELMDLSIKQEVTHFIQSRVAEYEKIKYVAEEHLIPFIEIRLHPYSKKEIEKTVLKFIKESTDRQYIFERAHPISFKEAVDYLEHGQFLLSRYFWNCPVRNFDKDYPIKLLLQTPDLDKLLQPFIQKDSIYFVQRVCHNVERFFTQPYRYTSPMNVYQITKQIGLLVAGPRHGGSNSLCQRITKEFQLTNFTLNGMIQYVLKNFKWSKLAKGLIANGMKITNNQEICDLVNICVNFEALGWILRDLPLSADLVQCFILNSLNISLIIYLNPTGTDLWTNFKNKYNKEKFKRKFEIIEKLYELAENLETFTNNPAYCKGYHQNFITVNDFTSKWSTWNKAYREIVLLLRLFHLYEQNGIQLAAASLNKLDVPGYELNFRLSPLKLYCPLCWLKFKLFVKYRYPYTDDEDAEPLYSDNLYEKNLFQYLKHFYWSCNNHLVELMVNSETYLLTLSETLPEEPKLVKNWKDYENVITNRGYCPVAYFKSANTDVIIGLPEFSVLYLGKIYVISCESHCITFLQNPELFKNVEIEWGRHSIADINEDFNNMKQDFGTITPTLMTNALLECAFERPKHYGLDPSQSLEIFLGLFFKCHNTNLPDATVEVYKSLFLKFWDECQLVQRRVNEMQISGNPYILRDKKRQKNMDASGGSMSSAFGF